MNLIATSWLAAQSTKQEFFRPAPSAVHNPANFHGRGGAQAVGELWVHFFPFDIVRDSAMRL